MPGNFWFAWSDAADATWNAAYKRYDEHLLSALIEHAEGDIASLTIEIRNPRVGLLKPGRPVWAWFAWDDLSGTTHPLFFGRLVGIPTNMLAEVVTLKFIGKPDNYIQAKQNLAETLKVAPFYDPVFLSLQKRDDPDAILEGYGSLYHVGRPDLAVTQSDALIGEDGTESFNAGDSFYDSVKQTLQQSPLVACGVSAGISWMQAYRGEINLAPIIYTSYERNLQGKWPAPLSQLGGGWSVSFSITGEAPFSANQGTQTYNWSWHNNEKTHQDGDVMSITVSSNIGSNPIGGKITYQQFGVVDPFAVDIEGDPAPTNIPAITTVSKPILASQTRFGGMIILRYEASRPRAERVFFVLQSDVQPIITDPLITQDTEQITLDGADVGAPVLTLLNWTGVADSDVPLGTLVFPDDPSQPGQTSSQIASTAGHTGTTEPTFSNIAGDTTPDGTAVWTSLGTTQPAETAPDWTQYTLMPSGAVILPRVPVATPYEWLAVQGLIQNPPTGFSVGLGQVILSPTGFYFVSIKSGTTGLPLVAWPSVHGNQVTDNEVIWACIGSALPPGDTYFIATGDGETGQILPDFASGASLGDTVTDSGVIWTCIGAAEVPIGGYPGNTPRASYFPTDRGLQSLQYLIMLARARLRLRSRAVEVSFDCHFDRAVSLSCRKNAVLFDPRLPGGSAAGKIIRYSLRADGDSGVLIGNVTIGCAVGNGNALVITAGTPVYVNAGYFNAGEVQQYTGRVDAINDDVGFSAPADVPFDDGLTFPLTEAQAVLESSFNGAVTGPVTIAVNTALDLSLAAASLPPGGDPTAIINAQAGMNTTLQNNVSNALAQFPVWYRLALAPVQNGPFAGAYTVDVTKLMIPKLVDLEAASGP